MRGCSDHIQKIGDHKLQDTQTLENIKKRLLDIRIASQQTRESLDQSQSKVGKCRTAQAELQIELEKERCGCFLFLLFSSILAQNVEVIFFFFFRFEKKRIEEELEVVGRKASRLEAQIESSSVVEKLHEELGEYEKIVNCKICVNSRKQVNFFFS